MVSAFASFLVVKQLSRGLLDHDPVISENRSRPVERSTYTIAGYTHKHALIYTPRPKRQRCSPPGLTHSRRSQFWSETVPPNVPVGVFADVLLESMMLPDQFTGGLTAITVD